MDDGPAGRGRWEQAAEDRGVRLQVMVKTADVGNTADVWGLQYRGRSRGHPRP